MSQTKLDQTELEWQINWKWKYHRANQGQWRQAVELIRRGPDNAPPPPIRGKKP